MSSRPDSKAVVFLTGDVMTGRGVDQILPHPGGPELRESVVSDARTYVRLAERAGGRIPAPVDFGWPWGEALGVLDELEPDVRLINLETSVTTSSEFAPGKAVHYRMHPDNLGCLNAVGPDVCALANNHVLDFGRRGLIETLRELSASGIRCAGAGLESDDAHRPARVPLSGGGHAVIASVGSPSSGIPRSWAAASGRPGVALLDDLSDATATTIAGRLVSDKRPGDVAIVSVHWGTNWGYDVGAGQIRFAHRLIDDGVDVVHGHSSHHPRPIEVYRGKLILYGCGDTVDDYEGIAGYEAFRHELRLLYFASIERLGGCLTELKMVPMRMRRMRMEKATAQDAEWLRATAEKMSEPFGTRIDMAADGALTLHG
ncbi:CapA family protein [Mycolicibacterium celeriflavum]|uniref:CapA family protein n=1 Tax=Mycolicibacterium celeriflavum TaxID=1249101 RepID=UPI003CF6C045